MQFYLGTHMPGWLGDERFAEVPLFVSHRALKGRKTLPRALGSWALDGSGFSTVQIHGRWTFAAKEYAASVRRYRDEIGRLDWAAPMDWMCEPQVREGLVKRRKPPLCDACKSAGRTVLASPVRMRTTAVDGDERPTFRCEVCNATVAGKPPQIHVGRWRAWAERQGNLLRAAIAEADRLKIDAVVVFHGTGLSVDEHQERTVENFLELRRDAPDLRITPVLQGWTPWDYLRCLALYEKRGVNLRAEPLVGVGSVCRRQGTATGERIIRWLAEEGLRLHGFGFKIQGLQACHDALASADSMAWSFAARRDRPLPGHDQPGPGRPKGHINCANCPTAALLWRDKLLASLTSAPARRGQLDLLAWSASC